MTTTPKDKKNHKTAVEAHKEDDFEISMKELGRPASRDCLLEQASPKTATTSSYGFLFNQEEDIGDPETFGDEGQSIELELTIDDAIGRWSLTQRYCSSLVLRLWSLHVLQIFSFTISRTTRLWTIPISHSTGSWSMLCFKFHGNASFQFIGCCSQCGMESEP